MEKYNIDKQGLSIGRFKRAFSTFWSNVENVEPVESVQSVRTVRDNRGNRGQNVETVQNFLLKKPKNCTFSNIFRKCTKGTKSGKRGIGG